MAWASLYFSVRLVSCCKNGTALLIRRTYESVQYIPTQPNLFYCRHVHFCAISSGFINTRPAGSRTMKMSVSFPPKPKKKPKQTLPPWILPPAVNSAACAETLIADGFFSQTIIQIGNWQTCSEGDAEGGGKYRVAEIEAISARHTLGFFFLRSKCGFVISVSLRLLALWNLPFQKRFAAPSKRSVLSFPSFADWEDEGRGGKQQKECDVQTISRENQWGYWKGYWKRRGGGVAQRGSVTLKEERKWQPGSSDPIIIVPLSLLLSSPHVRPFLLFNPPPPTRLSHPLHSPLLSLPSHILPPLLPLSSVIFLPLVPLACLCCSRWDLGHLTFAGPLARPAGRRMSSNCERGLFCHTQLLEQGTNRGESRPTGAPLRARSLPAWVFPFCSH